MTINLKKSVPSKSTSSVPSLKFSLNYHWTILYYMVLLSLVPLLCISINSYYSTLTTLYNEKWNTYEYTYTYTYTYTHVSASFCFWNLNAASSTCSKTRNTSGKKHNSREMLGYGSKEFGSGASSKMSRNTAKTRRTKSTTKNNEHTSTTTAKQIARAQVYDNSPSNTHTRYMGMSA